MEDRYQHTVVGQEVQEEDLNTLGETSALADDRVLAELLRMIPHRSGEDVTKAILPYGTVGRSTSYPVKATVEPGTGKVVVRPFRAVIASRTDSAASTAANKKAWRDIRSAVFVGDTIITCGKDVAVGNNAIANPRYDLVYAVVTPDLDSAAVSRLVKSTSTSVPAAQSIATKKTTTVTVAIAQGTAGASPQAPAITADGAGSYYIPLALVRVPASYAGGALAASDIIDIAPVLPASLATGTQTLRPASYMQFSGLAVPAVGRIAYANTGDRPPNFLPPSMVGGEALLIPLRLADGVTASVNDGDVIDESRDWRKRFFKWTAFAEATLKLATDKSIGGGSAVPSGSSTNTLGTNVAIGMGQSFALEGQTDYYVAGLINANLSTMDASGAVVLYADASTGKLRVGLTGTPKCNLFIWLEASAPFAGF